MILVGAGAGTRLGAGLPKAFVPLAGRPLLWHALRGVLLCSEPAHVVIVVPDDLRETAASIAAELGATSDVTVVAGGASRQDSVARGIAALPAAIETVLVHDAARPLTPSDVIDRVVAAVRESDGAVIPVIPVADTLRRIDGGVAGETIDRDSLGAVQTPQGFPRQRLEQAYRHATVDRTDDAALVAELGLPVTAVAGDPRSFKITTPWDLRRAELELAEPAATPVPRVGVGVDVHAFDVDATLWLGGVHWPDEPGLAGHSDGDALSHAICDALLSAAALGDLGGLVGTDDPEFSGAHGEVFLRRTVARLREAGWRVSSVSAQVIGNRPKIGPRRDELQRVLGELLDAPVAISATTTDGLGFLGAGDGIAAIATAVILPL